MVHTHNFTLGVTWAGSLLATPLPIGMYSEKVPKKSTYDELLDLRSYIQEHTFKYIFFFIRMHVCM